MATTTNEPSPPLPKRLKCSNDDDDDDPRRPSPPVALVCDQAGLVQRICSFVELDSLWTTCRKVNRVFRQTAEEAVMERILHHSANEENIGDEFMVAADSEVNHYQKEYHCEGHTIKRSFGLTGRVKQYQMREGLVEESVERCLDKASSDFGEYRQEDDEDELNEEAVRKDLADNGLVDTSYEGGGHYGFTVSFERKPVDGALEDSSAVNEFLRQQDSLNALQREPHQGKVKKLRMLQQVARLVLSRADTTKPVLLITKTDQTHRSAAGNDVCDGLAFDQRETCLQFSIQVGREKETNDCNCILELHDLYESTCPRAG